MILKIILVFLAIINGIMDIKQNRTILGMSWLIFAVVFSVINIINVINK